jgi:transcriptional regulator with GAF, ATPase, and Fis domain
MARSSGRIAKLPTGVRVQRGDAPAAGFEKIADPEGSADEMARDLAALERKLRDVPGNERALTEFMVFTSHCGTPETLLAALPGALPEMVPYDAMVVYRRQGDILYPCCSDGEARALFGTAEVRAGDGLSGWVAEHGKAIVNGNPGVEPAYLRDPQKLGNLRSALAVPLITDRGIAGVLSLYRKDNDSFTSGNLATLTALSSVVANAIESTSRVPA